MSVCITGLREKLVVCDSFNQLVFSPNAFALPFEEDALVLAISCCASDQKQGLHYFQTQTRTIHEYSESSHMF